MDKGLKAELVKPGVYRCTWGFIWDLKVYGCEGYDVEEIDDDIDLIAEALVTVGHWPCGLDAFRSPIRLRRAFEYWRSELLAHDSLGIFRYPSADIVQVGPLRTGGVEELISDLTEEAFEAMGACASAS